MKAVRDANDRIAELNKEIPEKQAEIAKLQKEFDKLDSDHTMTRQQEQIDAKKAELDRAKDDLNKMQTEQLPDAQEDLGEAQRRQVEDYYKAPKKGKDDAGSAAHDFGSQFLGGLAQSLGFPDVFGGKAPWDFEVVKLAGRFLTGFTQGMQQQNPSGAGGPGSGGFPGGMASGAGFPAMNAPGAAPPQFGYGTRFAPSPAIQGTGQGPLQGFADSALKFASAVAPSIDGKTAGQGNINTGFQGGMPQIAAGPNAVPAMNGQQPAGAAPGVTYNHYGDVNSGHTVTLNPGQPSDAYGDFKAWTNSTAANGATTPGAFTGFT